MNFKRFVARLFNIQPSDLQDDRQDSSGRPQIDESIRIEIKKQVQQELRRAIEKNIFLELPAAEKITSPKPRKARSQKLDDEHPVIAEEPVLVQERSLPAIVDEPILPLQELETAASSEGPVSLTGKVLRLGIDFGTTTTSVSVKIGDEMPVALPIGKDGVTRYMPSVVYINPGNDSWDQRAIVGEDAESQGDETKRIRSIKRCLDCMGDRCRETAAQGQLRPPLWCVGDGSVRISEGVVVPPIQIAHLIIQEALERATKYIHDKWGHELRKDDLAEIPLNIGCGARFSLTQRDLLLATVKQLGIEKVRIGNIVEEPILAGFAFSRFEKDPAGYSLIFDFGGGTLDIAVIDVTLKDGQPSITVLSTSGDPWLGGDDIDTLVYQEFIHQIAGFARKSPAAVEKGLSWLDRGNLRSQARTAKERLTDQRSYEDTYNLEGLGFVDLSLDVEKFEGLLENSGLVERSLKAVHEALKLALALDGAFQSDLFNIDIFKKTLPEAGQFVQRVIPVGGITKIPYIRRKLAEVFGESKIVPENIIEPIMAVAIGAAFKKEKEHFSISVPPFGFVLQFWNDRNQSDEQTISMIKPFEYYEFYKSIASIALPLHSTPPLDINKTYYDCRLLLEYADGRKEKEFSKMGNLHEGGYEFSIALNGDVYLNRSGATLIPHGQIPYLHPLQERISKERENRANKRRKDMDAKRNDSMTSMTWEN